MKHLEKNIKKLKSLVKQMCVHLKILYTFPLYVQNLIPFDFLVWYIHESSLVSEDELLLEMSDKKLAGNFGNLTALLFSIPGDDDPPTATRGFFFCMFLVISTQTLSTISRKSLTMANS